MSFGIVRIQKFKASDVRGIQSHDRRERDSRSNPDIDKSLSHKNYSLVESDIPLNQAVQNRLDSLESTRAVRKDAVTMCQILVTSDSKFFEGLTPEKEKQFFQQSLEFLAERYGKENIVSATVHKDEKTPHMHVNLTPIRDGRLTAKDIFKRQEFTALHTDFHKAVGQKWGLDRGETREEKKKHLDTQEFKLQTKKEQLQERMEEMRSAGVWLKPEDVTPKVLKKSLLSRVEETPDIIAKRVNESFIAPMAAKVNDSIKAANEMRTAKDEMTRAYHEMREAKEAVQSRYREFSGLRPEQLEALKEKAREYNAANEKENEEAAERRQIREEARKEAEARAVERKRVDMEFSRLLRNTPGTVGQHMEQCKDLMAQWDKAPDKKAFEKAVNAHFGKDKGIER